MNEPTDFSMLLRHIMGMRARTSPASYSEFWLDHLPVSCETRYIRYSRQYVTVTGKLQELQLKACSQQRREKELWGCLCLWMPPWVLGASSDHIFLCAGVQEAVVTCLNKQTREIADETLCVMSRRPPQLLKACSLDPCPPRYASCILSPEVYVFRT